MGSVTSKGAKANEETQRQNGEGTCGPPIPMRRKSFQGLQLGMLKKNGGEGKAGVEAERVPWDKKK